MPNSSRCTVLLVDDTEEHLDILVESLGDEMDLTVAMDGESALEILSEEIPDLILLDVEMPGMNGYEVCRRLRANPATARTPVVFLSARSETADRNRALELGAVDYITKPFVAGEVLARVRSVLRSFPCMKS